MSASDSEFDDSDYDSFISSLSDTELESISVALPSTLGLSSSDAGQPDDELDELVASLQRVEIHRDEEAGPCPPSPPRTPPNRTRSLSDNTLYRVQSPKKGNIITPHWSVAADLVQSETGARVVAEIKREKSKTTPKYYVVFIGIEPGVYATWRECKVQTTGVPSVVQGYASQSDAIKAFTCALERRLVSWVGDDEPLGAPTPAVDFMTAPESAFDNELNVGITRKRWYNVYQGRCPGIYRTYLECSLNVLNVSNAVHDSFFTLKEARDLYSDAIAGERILVRM